MIKLILMMIALSCGGSSGSSSNNSNSRVSNLKNNEDKPKPGQYKLNADLLAAIQKEDISEMTKLIEAGADVNGEHVLVRSIWTNNKEVVKLLLDKGVKLENATIAQKNDIDRILNAVEKSAQEQAEKKAKEIAELTKEAEERQAREEDAMKAEEAEERQARELAKKKAEEEAEQKVREENARKAEEESERQARKLAEKKAKEIAELKKEAEERQAREEDARKVKEESERQARELAEKKAEEEAEQKDRDNRLIKKGLISLLESGDWDNVLRLLDFEEVNVNETDRQGNNILHIAITATSASYNEEVINKILKKEIDFNQKNNNGNSPLFTLITHYKILGNISSGDRQKKNHFEHILDELLKKEDVDVSYTNVDESFLVKAVTSNFVHAVKKLLDREVTLEEVSRAKGISDSFVNNPNYVANNSGIFDISDKLEEKYKEMTFN